MANPQGHHQPQQNQIKHGIVAIGAWDDIDSPGTYVEVQGSVAHKLLRIPEQALQAGSSPLIRQQTQDDVCYIRLSPNVLLTNFEAEMLCAENNYVVKF